MYNISVRFVLQFKGPHNFDVNKLFGIYNRLKANFLGQDIEVTVNQSIGDPNTFIVEYQLVTSLLDFVERIENECTSHVTHSLYPHYQIDQDSETYNMNINIMYSVGIQYVSEVDEEYLTETYAEWEYVQEPDIEPEDCEECKQIAEESGFEYEPNHKHDGVTWFCENCNKPV
jgi:hypothetical protein